jgi:beta-lactamase class A
MASRTRRWRSRSHTRLRGLLVFLVVGGSSIFIAANYAVDWGRASATIVPAVAPTAPLESIARAEDTASDALPTTEPAPTATLSPPIESPTRIAPTAQSAATLQLAGLATPTGAPLFPTGEQVARVPFVPDLALAAEISTRIVGRSGRWGVAVKNLRTGQGVLINPDSPFEAASLFKLPVMYEVFKQREARALSFDEQLVLTDRHVAYDLGTLDRPAGATMGVWEALERMITFSDNSSAVLLTDRVGAFAVNRDLVALGMPQTRVLLDDLTTSPADMLRLLEMLALGEAVSPSASAEMVQLLARQRVNNRLPSLLPPDTTVAHKTGNLPGVVNDVGIVYGPSGPFVVAVLVDRTNDEGEAIRATADIALMAYRRFN